MRHLKVTIALAFCLLLLISTVSAQQVATTSVPNLIRYSGTLKDAQGAPSTASAVVGVTFAIYKQQDGGASVWQETQNVTLDASGQYNVVLGSTTATGLPDDLFSQQEQRWLGVQIQGEAEQARVMLVSVPYAFKAHEADTLGGLPATAFVRAPTDDANASSKASATDACATEKHEVNSSGVQLASQDGSGWVRDNQIVRLAASTDKIGVGTSTPKAKLDVEGNIHASGSISSGNATVTLNGNENAITVDSVAPTGGGLANQLYIIGEDAAGTTPPSKIQVGIGTKTPSAIGGSKVQIFDPTFPTLGISGGTTATNVGSLELTIATTAHFFSNFAMPGDAVVRVPNGSNTSLILTNRGYGSGGIRFGTGQACGGGFPCETEKMTLLQNGNFGIGSNSPPTTFAVGNFLNPTDQSNPPFQVNNLGDMVKIKQVAYLWPITQPSLGQVLTAVTGTTPSLAVLGWASSSGGVSGTCNPPGGFFLTKWLTSTSVQCSSITELPNTFVGIGPNETNPSRQLQVNGDIDIPATGANHHYQILENTVLSIDNTIIQNNLFVGVGAGAGNTGKNNVFVGTSAGSANSSDANNFVGVDAGLSNSGSFNSFFGTGAGANGPNTGNSNTFLGNSSGASNQSGTQNTFVGLQAGAFNKTGSNNVLVGVGAGATNSPSASNNVDLANPGAATDNGVIRIGAAQSNAYMAGIWNVGPINPAANVCIDATGHLGTICVISSLRFKDQIADMGDSSSKLLQLRPVTFFYKPQYDDGSRLLQYGLIAEEVAKVYPDMAVYGKDGQPLTVKYQMLAPMLLNELQKEHAVVMTQQDQLQTQLQQIKVQRQEIDGLKLQLQQQNASLQERLQRLESYVETQMKTASDTTRPTTVSANGGVQ